MTEREKMKKRSVFLAITLYTICIITPTGVRAGYNDNKYEDMHIGIESGKTEQGVVDLDANKDKGTNTKVTPVPTRTPSGDGSSSGDKTNQDGKPNDNSNGSGASNTAGDGEEIFLYSEQVSGYEYGPTEYSELLFPRNENHTYYVPDGDYNWYVRHVDFPDEISGRNKALSFIKKNYEYKKVGDKLRVHCYLSGSYEAESYPNGKWYYQTKKIKTKTMRYVSYTMSYYSKNGKTYSKTDFASYGEWEEEKSEVWYNDKTDLCRAGENKAKKATYAWKIPPRPGCDPMYDDISKDCEPYDVDATEIEELQDPTKYEIGWEIIRDY